MLLLFVFGCEDATTMMRTPINRPREEGLAVGAEDTKIPLYDTDRDRVGSKKFFAETIHVRTQRTTERRVIRFPRRVMTSLF